MYLVQQQLLLCQSRRVLDTTAAVVVEVVELPIKNPDPTPIKNQRSAASKTQPATHFWNKWQGTLGRQQSVIRFGFNQRFLRGSGVFPSSSTLSVPLVQSAINRVTNLLCAYHK